MPTMKEHDPLKDLLKNHSARAPETPEWGATQTWNKILEQRSLPQHKRWSWLRLAIPALALPSLIALVVLRQPGNVDDAQIQITENSILAIYADADLAAFDDSLLGEEIEDLVP
jgi:hypothetical protein